jgi:hypothetical protein
MKSPIQAAPVARGYARAFQSESVTQSCNWLKCGVAVARCAASCYPDPFNPACISCLGPAYDSCKSCF